MNVRRVAVTMVALPLVADIEEDVEGAGDVDRVAVLARGPSTVRDLVSERQGGCAARGIAAGCA